MICGWVAARVRARRDRAQVTKYMQNSCPFFGTQVFGAMVVWLVTVLWNRNSGSLASDATEGTLKTESEARQPAKLIERNIASTFGA